MSVITAYEDVGPCRKQLTIEVPAPAVEAEMGRVVGEYRRQVKLPGFRKGKVPLGLIQQRFREDIEKEVADRLIPRYWQQAQAEKNLEPLLPPRVEDLQLKAGEPMTFTASVEIRPRIELGDYRSFELPEGATEPSEDEVQETLDSLRRQHGTWVPVERAAARGDLVTGEMRPLPEDGAAEDGAADEGAAKEGAAEDASAAGEKPRESRPFEIEVGGEGVSEEMNLALTGALAGRSARLEQGVGEGAERKTLRFHLDIAAVKEKELPELDEEFVARVSAFETVEELLEAVRGQLRENKRTELSRRRERALIETLIERHPLELPAGVIEREVEDMLQDYAESLVRQGVDLEKVPMDWERMAADIRPQAERRVHSRLLLDAIAEAEGLKIDEKAFEAVLAQIAAQQGQSAFVVRQQLSQAGRLEHLRTQMLRERTVKFLLGELDEDEGETVEVGGQERASED